MTAWICGCGAEVGSPDPRSEVEQQDLGARVGGGGIAGAGLEPQDAVAGRALQVDSDGIEIRGVVRLTESALADQAFSVGLRWVIEESLYPLNPTTGNVTMGEHTTGMFVLRAGAQPLAEALVINEATNRAGVAVAYLNAYVDADSNGVLGCGDPAGCSDFVIGASPNTMAVYADEAWPLDGDPLFGFNGAAGVRPPRGWSLVHLTHNGPLARPTAREWTSDDMVELLVIGDFRAGGRDDVRRVQLDVD
jgi:hypothetical protein